MRVFSKQQIKELWEEYLWENKPNLLGFYVWANKECGPILPENRNLNPFKYVSDCIDLPITTRKDVITRLS